MNQGLMLRLLEQVMGWDDQRLQDEAEWLDLMSHYKYDLYRDFLAGARFIETLADWLQQFNMQDRETAYRFVRTQLVFISPQELNHLVERCYPTVVQKITEEAVASTLSIPSYLIWSMPRSEEDFREQLRKTLFLGLSDGARIDAFRRANEGLISNEQVFMTPQSNLEKWTSLSDALKEDMQDPKARFRKVFLIDDFVGSGKTLLRQKDDGSWTGKLQRFWDEGSRHFPVFFESGWSLHIHHYVASAQAAKAVASVNAKAAKHKTEGNWYNHVDFTFGMILPETLPVDPSRDPEFWNLTESYYNHAITTKSMKVGGDDARRGFGSCALPLVLEHNTPNNSVSLLWAEAEATSSEPGMRPLFHRRQRHN